MAASLNVVNPRTFFMVTDPIHHAFVVRDTSFANESLADCGFSCIYGKFQGAEIYHRYAHVLCKNILSIQSMIVAVIFNSSTFLDYV